MQRIILTNLCRQGYNIREEERQAEVKTKTRDKKVPPLIYVDAIEVIDQVAAAMNREERLLAYAKLAARLNKSTDLS